MAFRVTNHNPVINQEDVARNSIVRVVFSDPVLQTSIDGTTLSIIDAGNYTSVPGEYTFELGSDDKAYTAVFTPSVNYSPNSKYSVIVYGGEGAILSTSNIPLDNTYTFDFTTGNSILDDNTVSGLVLYLVQKLYNESAHKLELSFNLPIDTINTSGDIYLSTTLGTSGYTIPITVPFTYTLESATVDIPLVSSDYTAVEGWGLVEDRLDVKIAANVFGSYGRYNSEIDYTDVTYTLSGIYDITGSGDVSSELSGYTTFYIYQTDPKNQEPSITTALTGVYISFTGNILSTLAELSGLVTVKENPVLQ